jgi:hypothetical protein
LTWIGNSMSIYHLVVQNDEKGCFWPKTVE